MESWRTTWRNGIAPLLSDNALSALRTGLETHDDRLIQGETIEPGHWHSRDHPVEAACVIAYCGWQGEGLQTLSEVDMFFTRFCYQVEVHLGEAAAVRRFLNWYDTTPREEMRRELLGEIDIEENRRKYGVVLAKEK